MDTCTPICWLEAGLLLCLPGLPSREMAWMVRLPLDRQEQSTPRSVLKKDHYPLTFGELVLSG